MLVSEDLSFLGQAVNKQKVAGYLSQPSLMSELSTSPDPPGGLARDATLYSTRVTGNGGFVLEAESQFL